MEDRLEKIKVQSVECSNLLKVSSQQREINLIGIEI